MANIERTSSARILRGTAGVLEITVYSDGVLTDPTVPSVSVVDDTGAAVTTGTATLGAAGSGKVTATIAPAQTASVNNLTATWTLTLGGAIQTFETYHQIVGDVLFTEAELRAFDGNAVASSSYTDVQILAIHDLIAESFEQIVGVAFGRRFARETIGGFGVASTWLSHKKVSSIRAVETRTTTTWTAFTGDELTDILVDPRGLLTRDTSTWPLGTRNIRVDFEHGYQPIPFEVKRAAMWVARNYLTGSNIPRNAISQVDDVGSFQLSTPGMRGSFFGIPEVDRVLQDYRRRHRIPGLA